MSMASAELEVDGRGPWRGSGWHFRSPRGGRTWSKDSGGGGGAVPARLSVALAASVSSARRRRLASHPLITSST